MDRPPPRGVIDEVNRLFTRIKGFANTSGTAADLTLSRSLTARANKARDEGRLPQAAALYDEAIRLGAKGGPIRVQAGHMHKEIGAFEAAEAFYADALKLMPDNEDLALQLGHFYKTLGRSRDAQMSYERALELKPGWTEAERELANLRRARSPLAGDGHDGQPTAVDPASDQELAEFTRGSTYARLVPELMPLPLQETLHRNGESIHLRRLGRVERTYWGNHVTLRGVEAIRGFCISADPILEVQILLNGLVVYRGPTRAYPLRNELENHDLRKYVFNVWIDLQTYLPGKYEFEVRFSDARNTRDEHGGRRWHRQDVVIAEPLPEPIFEGGDAWTPLTDPDDPRSVEDQINQRPSVISEAKRSIFKTPPRNILVLRTDQLGDVVASVPAMLRMRELFPDAKIVGLFTGANVDLARTLDVFDEIIVIDFPDEKEVQRRRVMTAEHQQELRERLAPYKFDLALDLAPAVESRPLLLLSGAPFLAGMRDKNWPYITCGFDLNTYDAMGRSDIMPASSKTLAFIESLDIMMHSRARVVQRPGISRQLLEPLGIGEGDSYVVVHTGARVIFSRWAHYTELAQRLLARTTHKVVMLTEDPATRSQLPDELLNDERFLLLDRRLQFDQFDAVLSFCTCFVGNDSGPKHLASLRGANVVSLHTARINWGEWGQEQTGKIIHRQVPCAGCHVYHDPEECGKDYACVRLISLDDVWTAMEEYL